MDEHTTTLRFRKHSFLPLLRGASQFNWRGVINKLFPSLSKSLINKLSQVPQGYGERLLFRLLLAVKSPLWQAREKLNHESAGEPVLIFFSPASLSCWHLGVSYLDSYNESTDETLRGLPKARPGLESPNEKPRRNNRPEPSGEGSPPPAFVQPFPLHFRATSVSFAGASLFLCGGRIS